MTALREVLVKVPATTSNLGPGFDVLGMALSLHNIIEVALYPKPRTAPVVEIFGEGENSLPKDRTNMVVQAARHILPSNGMLNRLRFRLINRIPLARGLGSSAAARLGGLMAARAISGRTEGDDRPLELACRLEGHPDNVVPAFHGGLCVSLHNGDGLHFFQLNVPKDLGVVVCVPQFELATEKARRVLPKKVQLSHASETAARVAFLVGALEHKRYDRLKVAMKDVLHQPYRRHLIPGMTQVIDAANDTGAFGAALSGAGPSILALAPRGPRCAVIGRAMQKAFFQRGVESRYYSLDIERQGATAEIL